MAECWIKRGGVHSIKLEQHLVSVLRRLESSNMFLLLKRFFITELRDICVV
jgi:hypothetical protein